MPLNRAPVLTAAIIAACLYALGSAGCRPPSARAVRSSPSTSLTREGIIRRSIESYRACQTLEVAGRLVDNRDTPRRVRLLRWWFDGPTRCRIQIDMQTAVVSGDDWWVYDPDAGRFRKRPLLKRTVIDTAATAAFLLSDRVDFLLPILMSDAEVLFFPGGRQREWASEGFAWHADRPCFVLSTVSETDASRLTIWIDQDSYLLRGWRLSRSTAAAAPGAKRPRIDAETLLAVDYPVARLNQPLPADAFVLNPPEPITLPRKPARPSPGEAILRGEPMP